MKKVLVIAPHADDETLGCGGVLHKYKSLGYELSWLLVTEMSEEAGYTATAVKRREKEIEQVKLLYGFSRVFRLRFYPAQLDILPRSELIREISSVISEVMPQDVFTPFGGDVHSDHKVVFDAVAAASKTFRNPCVKRLLAYETLSETDFALQGVPSCFNPNLFVDIDGFLEKKLEALTLYQSEIDQFPFPRSTRAVEALASLRGVQAGCRNAEAFVLLKGVE